ncbi:ammonium transporter [Maritalea mediterranea]|uniref:Ammonium transporter n=1 Tax=Maritalea mediterranea TaxID=2909667 RepID=A0ABS9EDZ2_9HYPH|nr:ammonium transporter [Maritalea mediterranea]MCF4099618.1 ammonium transporter [Maritalea mediterranea]
MMVAADTSWILVASALVLLMTLPGLALFYAGLVQAKNILSVLMHCMAIACVASILWVVAGYSLAFTPGNAWLGDFSRFGLAGLERDGLSGTIPESLWIMFQMTFAVITPALMVGAFVERIKFSAVLIISGAWLMLVYVPVTHWVWGGGWLAQMGVIDFAGGIVVHVTAGVSAAVIAVALGPRDGFPKNVRPPHAPWMVMVGACLLWVGWFGFNGGSAVAADGNASMAILVTHLSAATASLVWMVIEWVRFGKPSIVGIVTGTIAGLATITPASGSVGPVGGIVLGFVGGAVCFYAVDLVKHRFKIDDSLDVLAVHGIGGATGTLLVALLLAFGPGAVGYAEGQSAFGQLGVQFVGVAATAIWSLLVTLILVWLTKKLVGLRVDQDAETSGLDLMVHGETGYRH